MILDFKSYAITQTNMPDYLFLCDNPEAEREDIPKLSLDRRKNHAPGSQGKCVGIRHGTNGGGSLEVGGRTIDGGESG